jgi:hypothetical protein
MRASCTQKNQKYSNKNPQKSPPGKYIAFYQQPLPTFTLGSRVVSMNTAHTLILLRQHACQRLVSPRLRG